MKFAEFLQSKSGLAGIGVLAFAVFAIVSLFALTDGGEHPLALESDVDLCGLLGEEVWVLLGYPAADPVVREPAGEQASELVCAFELDPVPAGDRWARIARGDDAHEVRRIATVRLNTTATLRAQNPSADSRDYAETFDREMVASGWSSTEVEGPWSWGAVYTMGNEETAALAEDDGVVLHVTASEVDPDSLVAFAQAASERIRPRD